jgi:hypothetical protein
MSTCPVCYDTKIGAFFVCGHGLCKSCAFRWFIVRDSCPVCREVVGSSFCDAVDLPHINRERARMMSLGKGYELSFDKNVFITSHGVVSWFKKNVHL